jgi:hypothetical protein
VGKQPLVAAFEGRAEPKHLIFSLEVALHAEVCSALLNVIPFFVFPPQRSFLLMLGAEIVLKD